MTPVLSLCHPRKWAVTHTHTRTDFLPGPSRLKMGGSKSKGEPNTICDKISKKRRFFYKLGHKEAENLLQSYS